MNAALKILWDVLFFRLKKLEMANLFAAGAIMVAVLLPVDGLASLPDIVVRLLFGVLLNVLAYLTNDYFDVDQDLASPNKDHAKTRFLKDHMKEALWAQVALAALLGVFGFLYSKGLLVALVAGAGNCWLYSATLKRLPWWDVLSMFVWGLTMPLIGFPLDNLLGWVLVGQLALYSASYESIQIVRDHDEDVATGVRTTAVRLGVHRTVFLARFFLFASAVFGTLFLSRWVGALALLAAFLPLTPANAARQWNLVRLITGLVWLAMIAWIFLMGGRTDGLLLSVDARETIPALAFLR